MELRRLLLIPLLGHFFISAVAQSNLQPWERLIQRLVRNGHLETSIREVFARPECIFDQEPMSHKLHALFEVRFKAKRIRSIQEGLQQLGFDSGPLDGLEGWRTQSAILAFQRKYRLPRKSKASAAVLRSVQEALDPSLKDEPSREGPPVYAVILRKDRLTEARQFLKRHQAELDSFEQTYGIPEEVAVGILAVETRVGKYLGEKKAFNTLASMSEFVDYKLVEPLFSEETLTSERRTWLKSSSRRVANWAYAELSALLHYAEANQHDALSLVGSIYGAIGLSQFMPTSAIEFGVDGDGDGRVDLFSLEDALHSMANYLQRNGWESGTLSRRSQARVLYRYNRSRTYVNTVLAVADHLRSDDDGRKN